MKKNVIIDGFILVFCVLISGIATYIVGGAQFTLWSALSALHAYKLFNSPKKDKNIFTDSYGYIITYIPVRSAT